MIGSMRISGKRMRDTQRIVHLVGGLLLLIHVYAPWGNSSSLTLVIQGMVVPTLVATGLAMWQLPRLRARLKRHQAAERIGGGKPA